MLPRSDEIASPRLDPKAQLETEPIELNPVDARAPYSGAGDIGMPGDRGREDPRFLKLLANL